TPMNPTGAARVTVIQLLATREEGDGLPATGQKPAQLAAVSYVEGVRLPLRNVEERVPGGRVALRTNSIATVFEAVRLGWGGRSAVPPRRRRSGGGAGPSPREARNARRPAPRPLERPAHISCTAGRGRTGASLSRGSGDRRWQRRRLTSASACLWPNAVCGS